MNHIFDELLKKHNITRYQLSKATGVPQSSLSDFLNDKSTPKYESMKKIADYFNVSVDYLLGKEDIKKAPAEKAEVSDDDIQFALFGGKITDEAYEDVKRFAEFIKQKYKDKD
jgi:transcriptional regulator with XRE-family HTH domain